jgi:fumarylacetoacetate (FAA) hydrolase
MEAGASDDFSGPCDALRCGSEALELDFEAQLAVITGDVPRLASATQALEGIRLVVLANAVRLRSLSPGGLSTGLNLIQGKPAIAFSPVALTLDEFGTGTDSAWNHGRLNLTLQSSLNGRRLGRCEAGPGMNFHFGELIAELCATRPMRAGTVLGSGPVSNQDASLGFSCIAEMRAMEILRDGQPATGFLKHGDVLRIEMKGRDGQSMFGVIEQQITPFQK